MAITALVLGIVGVCLFLIPVVGQLLGLAAIILGILGIRQCEDPAVTGKGMAIAGLVLGILAVVLFVVFYLIIGLAFEEFFNQLEDMENQIVLFGSWLPR